MKETCVIFNGPSTAFQQIIDKENENRDTILNLRDLVKTMDSHESFNIWLEERKAEEPCILLGFGESFSSIREHFIDNLPGILQSLIESGYINKCYFQNPPIAFKKGLKRIFNEELQETTYEYETVTKEKLLNIYQEYKQELVGQDHALIEILSTLYPLINKADEKPVIMMFFGPAGVGKTESAKIINNSLVKGELFRQQFSMFQTGEFASYLFGGSIDSPSLAKDLIKREGNVILFDEFNRCPPTFYSAFFQMFDEGIYVDKNYEVSLKNSIIICTANYESRGEILSALGAPLFSRFDHFISFSPLSKEAKEILIRKKYIQILENWDSKDREILEESGNLETLIEHVDSFTNARNIEKGVKGSMARTLVLNMLEEYKKEISD